MAHGHGLGHDPGHGGQAQILTLDGVLYLSNGANDVFAIDVETGVIRWSFKGNPDLRAGSPIGRVSRGVALGDGKVFAAQADSKLTALDQKTGKVVWQIQAERWEDGYAITAAPLYYDGLVIIGFNGAEMGTRGRIKAFDAKTGKNVWTFYTVPAPGEPGSETWPKDSDAWKRGGGNLWQTPALDPELGLLYFSTANPGPDLNGSVREGDNLYTNSMVAIEAKTGKYRWHFQQVHHDIWDYDSPNPVILFDASYGGVARKGVVQVSKTGWAYILDRTNGKPLIGIEERPVPQEPRQKTAATQPYPVGDAVVPQWIELAPEGANLDPATNRLFNEGPHLHAVLDRRPDDEAGHDGRRELAAELARSGNAPALCVRIRSHQQLRGETATRRAGPEQGLHGRQLHAGAGRRRRCARGARRAHEQARVAPGVA